MMAKADDMMDDNDETIDANDVTPKAYFEQGNTLPSNPALVANPRSSHVQMTNKDKDAKLDKTSFGNCMITETFGSVAL